MVSAVFGVDFMSFFLNELVCTVSKVVRRIAFIGFREPKKNFFILFFYVLYLLLFNILVI